MANIKKERSHSVEVVSPDRMPVFKANDGVLLMVMLTEFTEQREKALVDFLETESGVITGGFKVQTWTPSKSLLGSIALQGPHRDSQANIHALAMLAYRSGIQFLFRTSFVVADALTNRCWNGTHRVGERGKLSLLMVSAEPEITQKTPTSISSPPPGVRVVVSRFSDYPYSSNQDRGNQDRGIAYDDYDDYDDYNSCTVRRCGVLPFILGKYWKEFDDNFAAYYHFRTSSHFHQIIRTGIQGPYSASHFFVYLHDPDQKMFSTENTALSARKQYLKAAWSAISSRLPPELSTEIIALADRVPSFRAPLWRCRQSQEHLHIFIMFPTTEDELCEAHWIIHDALQKRPKEQKGAPKTAELIPLHRHGMRTRRDVVAFWEEYRVHEPDERCNDPLLNLMLNPIQNKNVNLSHFAIVCSGGARPVVALRTTFNTLGLVSTSGLFDLSDRDCEKYSIDLVEAAYNHDQPYYHNPPIWEAVGNSSADKYLRDYGWISVFYLTKHLTDSEDLILRKEIHKVDGQDRYDIDPDLAIGYYYEQRKDVCFVPWERDEDGTLDDIWNIVLKIYKHEGFGRRFQRFFCLDRQSVEDQTLIIVEPDFFLAGRKVQDEGELLQGMIAPTLAGFRCNRVRCEEAHDCKMKLDHCDRTIEEIGGLGNEGQHFIRPGWPGPDVLPPTNPWRLNWPEPGQLDAIPVWDIFDSYQGAVNDESGESGEEWSPC
ncbi:hypothetical protein N7486_006791 [Penicillium sp. IBT 16267x]|nr:hypothetical protein N7486_006791 [Penicillium sp. IBT 16267x]